MAEDNMAPSWAFEDVDKFKFLKEDYIAPEENERIQGLSLEDLSDDEIVEQRDQIEASANSKSLYHYNADWSDATKSSLREYAVACGLKMNKFKAVHPEYIESIKVVQKEAASQEPEKEDTMKLKLKDPFKLDELGDTSYMDESNWEDIHKQGNLADRPAMEGSVVPIRGGEDYNANSEAKTARGQNSITNPNAIQEYAESEEEDTGARLRRENEDKEHQREANHQEWQDDKIAAMEHRDELPSGKVFPTEVMNAQPGIRGEDAFGLDNLPDQTEGEKIAEANEQRRKEIQGEDKEEHEFKMKSASVRTISDTFSSELKKFLKK